LHVHHLSPRTPDDGESIILERDREFRLKLHLGSFPLGWLWLIPAFHLPEHGGGKHTITFTRSQVDFAIGPGQAIHKVVLELEAVGQQDARETTHLMSDTEEKETGYEDKRGEAVKEDGE
jgi:phosphatidylinositol-3,4,5-trisphosphate 3-phosphatase/dual-specificity protein phosphatase PTEN